MSEDQNTAIEDEVAINVVAADIHAELQEHGIKLHHRTGMDKLQATLKEVRAGTYEAPSPEAPKNVKPIGPTKAAQAAVNEHNEAIENPTKEQRAMALSRVIVTPNDPNMSAYSGLIFTVGSSAVNRGKAIKKFVPFNNEDGWHVPKIILDTIEAAEMQKFRPVDNGKGEKIMQPYFAKKFNVQVLPPLTKEEMDALAASQQAKGGF